MIFKKGQLVAILGCTAAVEAKYLDVINATCEKFSINTKLRLAAFIAQVGHESGRLSVTVENLNYSSDGLLKTFSTRFNTSTANSYARNPEKIANLVYASRMGNGNEVSGDGWKYRGRGLIQCTGKSNYDAYSQVAGFNAVGNPDALAEPTHAAMSAGWFWNSKGLNSYADRSDFTGVTQRVNGGQNGAADRELLYKKAIIVLSDGVPPKDDIVNKAPMPTPPSDAPTSSISTEKTPGAKNTSIVEPRSSLNGESKSKYPWNFVTESRSGHVSEVDDTPGYERLNMTHRTGSYWEIDNTGTYTNKSILDSYKLTKYDAYDFVGSNYTQQVKGQSYRQSDGDMVFKSGGVVYFTSSKIQMNTGMLAVSGEINSPNINANIFSGMSGLGFGNILSKEALVAYDIKKGKAPMLGQSLGFKSAPGAYSSGSADGLLTNDLSNKSPSGTPWTTNGVSTAAGAALAVGVIAAVISDIQKSSDPAKEVPQVTNALNSAATNLDKQSSDTSSETPVFVKHVSFDKPTLLSQSTSGKLPDPNLYVNNLHTVVDANGKGRLHMSNGISWIPVGDAAAADHDYTDDQIRDVVNIINANQLTTATGFIAEAEARLAALVAEAQARAAALLNESTVRQQELAAEARDRQNAITQGILAEATARGAAVQAESLIRQTEDESLANHILEITASTGVDIAAAVSVEAQARATAIEAEAFQRTILAAKVSDNTASISDEATTRSNETSALSTRVTNYIASNATTIASVRSEITSSVDNLNNALTTRIDSQQSQNTANKTLIESETTTRITSDSALSTRIDTTLAKTNDNTALIVSETTARTTADGALSTRIDSTLAHSQNNTALVQSEVTARTNAVSALSSRVDTVFAQTGSNTSLISSETTARTNADAALATRLDIMGVSVASIRAGTNLLFNAGFMVPDPNHPGQLPLGYTWDAYGDGSPASTVLYPNGPDGYNAVNVTWSLNTPSSNMRRGLVTGEFDNTKIRPKTNYIFAARVKASQNSMLGKTVELNDTNYPFQWSYIAKPVLTNDWQWLIVNVYYDNDAVVKRNFYITCTYGVGYPSGAGSFLVATPILHEGTTFLGFNLGEDPLIRINSALISTEQTVRADADNAIASSVQVISVTSTNAYNIANQAQAQADRANAEIANIASDNILSKGEKPTVIKDWSEIYNERDRYVNQAISVGVNYDSYSTSVNALATYLNSIGPGPESWQDLSRDSTIDGWTFRQKFLQVYSDRQNLIIAISNYIKTSAATADTKATTAQLQADAANFELTNIASDDILSKGEKPAVILDWNAISQEEYGILVQADNLGQDRRAYHQSVLDLASYLSSIGPFVGAWADISVNSPINGPTFRAKFADVYIKRQYVLNAIADAASKIADWGNIKNQPLDSTNLVLTPTFESGLARTWARNSVVNVAENVTWKKCLQIIYRNNNENNPIAVVPGETLYLSASLHTTSANRQLSFGLILQDKAGMNLGFPVGVVLQPGNTWTTLRSGGLIIPANCALVIPFLLLNGNDDGSSGYGYATNLYIGRAEPGATVGATWGINVNGSAIVDSNINQADAKAAAARLQADAANAELANIASDNILSKGEKAAVILDWNQIINERAGIELQANRASLSHTSYSASIDALANYLGSIGPFAGAWSNSTVDSAIDGIYFRDRFGDVYLRRQELLNAISEAAAAIADWNTIINKPLDTTNLCLTPTFDQGELRTWPGYQGCIVAVNNDPGISAKKFLQVIARDTMDSSAFFVTPGEKIYLSADIYTGGANYGCGVGLTCYDKNGGTVSFSGAQLVTPHQSYWYHSRGYTIIPPNAYRANVWLTMQGFTDMGWAGFTNIMVSRSEAGATAGATWGVDVNGSAVVDLNISNAAVAANNARDQANSAITQIIAIASDNVLSKGEKPRIIQDWNGISGEEQGILVQADRLGVDRTGYWQSVQNLSAFLSALGPYAGAWADVNIDSPIDGPLMRARFTDVYVQRQAVLVQISNRITDLANYAQATANTAQSNANTALTQLTNIAADNVLSRGEKSAVIKDWQEIYGTYQGIINQAAIVGVDYSAFYNSVVNVMIPYLQSIGPGGTEGWQDLNVDSSIDGATFRQRFLDVYTARQALLNAIALKINTGATTAQTIAQQAITNASGAQTAADNARVQADIANGELAAVASDSILSRGEKPEIIRKWIEVDNEYNIINGQADTFGVSRVAYETSRINLANYLTQIPYGWDNINSNSPIDGLAFRNVWNAYYVQRQALLTAITKQAKDLAKADANVNAASIVTESTARINGDNASAALIDTLSSRVGGHTTSINQNISSIQGVQANYSIKINNQGYISGFGLNSSTPIDNYPYSAFNIMADRFSIQSPSLNGGAPITPFSVDTSTTPPTIAMNGLVRFGGSSDGTGGKNILYNSGPSRDTIDGYSMGYNPVGSIGPYVGYDPYRPIGGGAVWIRHAGTPGVNDISDIANTAGGLYYPVIPGKRYELSIYLNPHRCIAATLIVWQDVNGNYITENQGNTINDIGVGSDIKDWGRSTAIFNAPAGASRCYVAARTRFLGQASPYLFTTMWYFGEAGVNQTSASPWSPSGVTTINGGMITANSISVEKLSIGSLSGVSTQIGGTLRSASSGGRTEISDNVIKVFDGNGTLRVKLGNLDL